MHFQWAFLFCSVAFFFPCWTWNANYICFRQFCFAQVNEKKERTLSKNCSGEDVFKLITIAQHDTCTNKIHYENWPNKIYKLLYCKAVRKKTEDQINRLQLNCNCLVFAHKHTKTNWRQRRKMKKKGKREKEKNTEKYRDNFTYSTQKTITIAQNCSASLI